MTINIISPISQCVTVMGENSVLYQGLMNQYVFMNKNASIKLKHASNMLNMIAMCKIMLEIC